MHVLLISLGSAGDVNPFIGIGREMKQRGHTVALATNGYFKDNVERAGLAFISTGSADDFLATASDPDLWNPRRSFYVVAREVVRLLEPVYWIIEENYVPGRTIVAASSLSLAARVAEEKLGVPTAMVHLQPGTFRSVYNPPILPGLAIPSWFPPFLVGLTYKLIDAVVDRELSGPINGFRAARGLRPVRSIMGTWWNSPRLTLGLFPAWFCPPEKDWPASAKLTGFPLFDGAGVETESPGLSDFTQAGAPPVVFTAGSAMKTGQTFFRISAEACAKIGCRAVFINKFPDQMPSSLPPGVRTFSFAPFSRLFPQASVVVHHGGVGTTAQAFRAGRPQLVAPFSHDQFDNGVRVEKLGTGLSLRVKKYTPSSVAAALNRLMKEPAFASTAARIAENFKGIDPLKETCDALEGLIR
jgi:UDP:flavonoid glycosyltransferase YjiC (YdhE family)